MNKNVCVVCFAGIAIVQGFAPCDLNIGRTSTTRLESSSVSSDAKNLLFQDMFQAAARRAELEGEILQPRMRPMELPKPRKTSGTGFGGPKLSKAEKEQQLRIEALREDGVVMIQKAMKRTTAEALRAAVLQEIDAGRTAVRLDPSCSFDRFHCEVEQPLRAFTKLPLDDALSDVATAESEADTTTSNAENAEIAVKTGKGVKAGRRPIATAVKELLGPKAVLGTLMGLMCAGTESELHDFYALRTEAGCPRQPVHFDTPHQDTPPFFAAFIALQDVTVEMGPTMFLPGTHLRQGKGRQDFDADRQGTTGRCAEMLAKSDPVYPLLKAGDLVMFDMRILHCGTANLPAVDHDLDLDSKGKISSGQDVEARRGGSQRIFLCVTFRNRAANAVELGHQACIRPGYVERITLGDVRSEIASASPFARFGDGLGHR